MASRNEKVAADFLRQRRNTLVSEIAALQGRLAEVDFMLAELEKPLPIPTNGAMPKARQLGYKVHEETLAILTSFGKTGATASELNKRMPSTPLGTLSSRLSQLVTLGRASHKKPRYFALTSN